MKKKSGPNNFYAGCVESEHEKAKEMKLIKEYEHFYLMGKIIGDKIIFKECFRKSDVDGVEKQKVRRKEYDGLRARGG